MAVRSSLEARLGYTFTDEQLFTLSLTHRSAGKPHNERLEFLGDAILGFLVAQTLYDAHPNAREGTLTRSRASLVRKESLASIAREIGLGEALHVGPGERKSGGRDRDSILADALEAVLGAVYIDGGIDAARKVVATLFEKLYGQVAATEVEKDPKTRLQEILQGRRLALPSYEVHDVEGDANGQVFTIICHVTEPSLQATGQGPSRRHAEQAAAQKLLVQFEKVSNQDEH
ncbi:MAG: ribonuclease-3 [Gammaproteobacteria bacterium]